MISTHRSATLERWIGTLNTPKTARVNKLFEELIGLTSISTQWHWKGTGPLQAQQKLDEYISIRGAIAHKTEHNETVYEHWISDYMVTWAASLTQRSPQWRSIWAA